MADNTVILIAPNVSARMGGEAIKALHIALELGRLGFDVVQVTHSRVRRELEQDYPQLNVVYVEDSWLQVLLDRAGLDWPLTALNLWQLSRLATRLAQLRHPLVVHSTSPISPVLPHFSVRGRPHVIGPLNGNIRFPPGLADRETLTSRAARRLHGSVQAVLGFLFSGKRRAEAILVAGGQRTIDSLLHGQCRLEQMVETLDSGVPTPLGERPVVAHAGENGKFVFVGRLIPLKGCDLAIRAVAAAPTRVTLDIIGDGPALRTLQDLSAALGVSDRVRFVGWIPAGNQLYDRLAAYRGFVFPSLADANGIAVQEAMMIGIPVVCLDWAGPGLLVDPSCGISIPPVSEDQIIKALAEAMELLAGDPVLANELAVKARQKAVNRGFDWTSLLSHWGQLYRRVQPSGRDGNRSPTDRSRSRINEGPVRLALRLWHISALFIDDSRRLSLRPRLRFLAAAISNRQHVLPLLDARPGSALADLVASRPETLAIVYWPYLCSSWSVAQRVASLIDHCEAIEDRGFPLRRPVDQPVELLDLRAVFPGCTLVLDQARWFMREGQMVLNLFVESERLFSLAFSLRDVDGRLEAIVGAVQGRGIVNVRESYKEMTKAFFGLRPRDLLIELFKTFCREIGVTRILAVSDQHRHHRSQYFGREKSRDLSLDYDQVWADRGGEMETPAFFTLPVELIERADPPARKRAMYRQRYEFLRSVEGQMRHAMAKLRAAGSEGPASQ